MTNIQAALGSFLLILVCGGCGPALETIPDAQAQAGAPTPYVTEFARMHAAIPAGAGSEIQDYQ
jgi:hypothetical protein